jgi:hypothetical protein
VTSQKIFPSRLSLGAGDAVDERGAGVKHLTNIFRRLHRIFAHAWFQHRGVFWQVEGQTGLYVLFKTVCDTYDLLPAENYKLPPEAEGLEPIEEHRAPVPSIMKSAPAAGNSLSVEEDFINVGRTNTRRHIRQSPSVGSAVTTVLESDEEEADVTQKLEELQISEEEGEAEVPVIVETYEVEEDREATGDLLESEPAGQSETSPDSVETAPSTTSSWDRMSSESLEDKQEAPEHEETKVEQLLDPVIEEDDAKTPFAKTQESFHDRPSILIEDEDEEQEPDAS